MSAVMDSPGAEVQRLGLTLSGPTSLKAWRNYANVMGCYRLSFTSAWGESVNNVVNNARQEDAVQAGV